MENEERTEVNVEDKGKDIENTNENEVNDKDSLINWMKSIFKDEKEEDEEKEEIEEPVEAGGDGKQMDGE